MVAFLEKLLFLGSATMVFNWLTTIVITLESAITKRHSSQLWIPFLGPTCLTTLFILNSAPIWLWPIPWVADIGTLGFLPATPGLLREIWRYSRFTRLMTLEGRRENQSVRVTLHRGGHYQLNKEWHRAEGEMGIIALGEPGTYEHDGPNLVLKSHYGSTRRLSSEGDGSYAITESSDVPENYSMQDWVLRIVDGDISQCS